VKKVFYLSSAVVFAAISAGLITFYLPRTTTPAVPAPSSVPTKSNEPLNVLDDTVSILSSSEQQSLSRGLASELSDPSGAQLRRLARSTRAGMICGELNAKNHIGAYVGFLPFAAGVAIPRAFIIMPKPDVMEHFPEVVRGGQTKMGCLNS
jgi:hypothetical protein